MTSHRASMFCGLVLAAVAFAGCSKVEEVQPPPPAAPVDPSAATKKPPSGRGYSTIDNANSSSILNKSAEPAKTP